MTESTTNMKTLEDKFQFQTLKDPQLEKMLRSADMFCESLLRGENPKWLSLVGMCGTGKTHLAKRIWRFYIQSNLFTSTVRGGGKEIIYPGQFCHWPKFADQLRASEGYGRLDDMKSENVVVLDDIGAEKDTTGFVTEKLSTLLSCRVGKWTIITSNLSVKQISEKLDTRISSRMLRDGGIIEDVQTVDFNLRKRNVS